MNLKQIFCKHRKTRRVSFTFIKTVREKTDYQIMGLPVYAFFNYFEEIHVCEKCSKRLLKSTKYMSVDHSCSILY